MCFRLFYKRESSILPDVTYMESIESIENNNNQIIEKNQEIYSKQIMPCLDITKSSLYKRRYEINKENIFNKENRIIHNILL